MRIRAIQRLQDLERIQNFNTDKYYRQLDRVGGINDNKAYKPPIKQNINTLKNSKINNLLLIKQNISS